MAKWSGQKDPEIIRLSSRGFSRAQIVDATRCREDYVNQIIQAELLSVRGDVADQVNGGAARLIVAACKLDWWLVPLVQVAAEDHWGHAMADRAMRFAEGQEDGYRQIWHRIWRPARLRGSVEEL